MAIFLRSSRPQCRRAERAELLCVDFWQGRSPWRAFRAVTKISANKIDTQEIGLATVRHKAVLILRITMPG
jgi:hypothetical protein